MDNKSSPTTKKQRKARQRSPLSGTPRKDGRWQITLTLTRADGTKKDHTIYAPSQREVQDKARDFLTINGHTAVVKHTIQDLYDECKLNRWKKIGEDAAEQYDWAWMRINRAFGGLKDVREIDPPMLYRWIQSLDKDPKLGGRSIQIHRNVLCMMLKHAHMIGWVKVAPPDLDSIILPKSAEPRPRRRLEHREALEVIDRELGREPRLFWWSMYETGMRPQEVSELKRSSIEYTLDRWWVRGGIKTHAGRDRFILVSDQLGGALYEAAPEDEGLIFPNLPFEKAGERSDVYDLWSAALAAANVEYTNLYQLRKLRVKLWKDAGVPDQAIKTMIGHTKIELTNERYDDVTCERIYRALAGEI